MRWRGAKSLISTSLASTQISSSSKSEKSGTERSVSGLQPMEKYLRSFPQKYPAAFHKWEAASNWGRGAGCVFYTIFIGGREGRNEGASRKRRCTREL